MSQALTGDRGGKVDTGVFGLPDTLFPSSVNNFHHPFHHVALVWGPPHTDSVSCGLE